MRVQQYISREWLRCGDVSGDTGPEKVQSHYETLDRYNPSKRVIRGVRHPCTGTECAMKWPKDKHEEGRTQDLEEQKKTGQTSQSITGAAATLKKPCCRKHDRSVREETI